jgi:hypothetical protein
VDASDIFGALCFVAFDADALDSGDIVPGALATTGDRVGLVAVAQDLPKQLEDGGPVASIVVDHSELEAAAGDVFQECRIDWVKK